MTCDTYNYGTDRIFRDIRRERARIELEQGARGAAATARSSVQWDGSRETLITVAAYMVLWLEEMDRSGEPPPGRYRDTDGVEGTLGSFDPVSCCFTFRPDGYRKPGVVDSLTYLDGGQRLRLFGRDAVKRLVPVDGGRD